MHSIIFYNFRKCSGLLGKKLSNLIPIKQTSLTKTCKYTLLWAASTLLGSTIYVHCVKNVQNLKFSDTNRKKVTLDGWLQQTSALDLIICRNEILCFYHQSRETSLVYLCTVYTTTVRHQSQSEKPSWLSHIASFRTEMFYCAMMIPVREYWWVGYIVEATMSGGIRGSYIVVDREVMS